MDRWLCKLVRGGLVPLVGVRKRKLGRARPWGRAPRS